MSLWHQQLCLLAFESKIKKIQAIEQKKLSLFSLKLTQMSLWRQQLYLHAFESKMKNVQAPKMFLIERNTHIFH